MDCMCVCCVCLIGSFRLLENIWSLVGGRDGSGVHRLHAGHRRATGGPVLGHSLLSDVAGPGRRLPDRHARRRHQHRLWHSDRPRSPQGSRLRYSLLSPSTITSILVFDLLSVIAAVCIVSYLIGLLFVTGSGEYWVKIFDSFAGTTGLIFIALLESVAVMYIYGHRKYVLEIISLGPLGMT